MNIMFTKSKLTGGLISRALLLLAMVLGVQLGSNAQITNPSPYCGATHNYMGANGSCYNNYGFAFSRIKVGTIDHKINCTSSSPSSGPYRFWNSGPTTTFSPGANYSITMTTASNSYPTYAGAWIDYNQNNNFEASEAIAITGQIAYPLGSATNNFTIPCTAKSGTTRMRVRIDYYYAFSAAMGCNNTSYGYGETMDYEVTIAAANNPTANFFIPDTIFTGSPADFLNANKVGYINHKWSTSVGGLGNVVGNSTNFSYAFPSAGNYQVRLISTNCGGSATVTKNVVVVDPTVAPTVRFLASRNYIPQEPTDYVVDEIVDFKDFSTSGPTSFLWEITPDASTKFWFVVAGSEFQKELSVFFTDTAKYDVCLTAENIIGATKLCKPSYVVIEYPATSGKTENLMCIDAASSLPEGTLYDQGGLTGNYPAQAVSCTFNINACDAEEIEMWFDGEMQFYYYGHVNIYDGKNTSGTLLATVGDVAGAGIVTTVPTKHYFAKSGYATIEFRNIYPYYSGKGFEMKWKSKTLNNGPLTADFEVVNTRNDSIYECLSGTEVRFTNKSSGTRDISDYQWIFDYDPNIAYPSGYEDFPDNGNFKNPTFIYSSAKTYVVRMVAESCEGWDTTYKTFHIGTTTMKPVVEFTADDNILTVGGSTKLHNKSVAWCSGEWTITPSTYTLLNGSTLTDQDIEVKFTAAGRYTVKYEAENDNGTTTRSKTDFIRVIEYCEPSVSNAFASMANNRVKINTLENLSGIGSNGYDDFTKSVAPTDLFIGSPYALEVERTQNKDAADRKVWIDYDRDGNFTASEVVASETNSTNKVLATTITIPDVSAVTPGLSRMRVAVALAGRPLDPCGPIDAGEFEDYMVNLKLDDQAPVITMLGSDSVYVEVGSTYTDAGATAMDNREGSLTSKIVTNNQVDINQTGIYVVTYNVKDGSGIPAAQRTRFVFVLADMTKPVITINGGATITHEAGTLYTDLGATATDNPGAKNIDNLIVTNNMVNVNALGTYTVEYTVTDAYGNTATETRTVNVVDTKAPVVETPGGDPLTIQVGTPFVDNTFATDAFEGTLPVQVVSGSVNSNVFGTYKVTYTAKDGSGNTATSKTRTYVVTDVIKPVLTSLSGTQYMVADVNDLNFVEPAVTGTDNYFPTVQITRNAGSFDISKLGTYDITYTGTDGAGNVTVWVRTIKVVDRVRPVVISTPVNIQRWMTFDPSVGVSTWDNYYAPVNFQLPFANNCKLEVISSNVNMLQVGLYQVIYQAVDGSGNVSEPHLRLVNVVENTTGIADVAFENGINIYPNPTSGKFDVDFAVAINETATITITNMVGQTIRTFSGSDVVNGKLSVDLTDVAAGFYTVQIESNGQVANKKVSVTR